MLTMIMVNFFVIIYLFYRSKSISKRIGFKQIFVYVLLILNLGMTWMLFAYMMNRKTGSSLVISYIFILFNASQVLLILFETKFNHIFSCRVFSFSFINWLILHIVIILDEFNLTIMIF